MMKILLTTVIIATTLWDLCAATCHETWTSAYTTATIQYQHDLDRCDDAFFRPQYCYDEAEAAYTGALNTAGNNYYCCVMGC